MWRIPFDNGRPILGHYFLLLLLLLPKAQKTGPSRQQEKRENFSVTFRSRWAVPPLPGRDEMRWFVSERASVTKTLGNNLLGSTNRQTNQPVRQTGHAHTHSANRENDNDSAPEGTDACKRSNMNANDWKSFRFSLPRGKGS